MHLVRRRLQWRFLCFNSKDSGSVDLNVNGLSVTESLAVKSDNTGRPEVNSISCAASVGNVKVKFHGGARLENPGVPAEVYYKCDTEHTEHTPNYSDLFCLFQLAVQSLLKVH